MLIYGKVAVEPGVVLALLREPGTSMQSQAEIEECLTRPDASAVVSSLGAGAGDEGTLRRVLRAAKEEAVRAARSRGALGRAVGG